MKLNKKTKNKTVQCLEEEHIMKKILNIEDSVLFFRQPYSRKDSADSIDISYRVNEYGFRCESFNNQEIMYLGCSLTFGQGLPEKYRWTNILSEKLNKSFINLAVNGDSMIGQVRNAFWYFKNFGHPKIIVGMFPISRMPFPVVPDKNISLNKIKNIKSRNINKDNWQVKYSIESLNISSRNFEDISKSPHDLSKIISEEGAIFYNNIAIEMLIQYCKSNNIKLFWTLWDDLDSRSTYFVELIYKEKYDSFVEISSTKWRVFDYGDGPRFSGPIHCHKERSDDVLFHRAADTKGENLAHWGLHRNIHIAQEFHEHILKRDEHIAD